MDNDIGLKSVHGAGSIAELCEIIEDNNKTISWLLKNLTSNNIISLDPDNTRIESAHINIDGSGITVYGAGGAIIAEITENGAVCGGTWNFSGASVSGV